MKFLKQRHELHIVSLSASLLLCVLLSSAMAQQSLSKGLLKKNPSVVLQASTASITLPCPRDVISSSGSCPSSPDLHVALTSKAKDFTKQPLYAYTVTAGRVIGEGSTVSWDLSGVWPGIYTATVNVQDNKNRAVSSAIVKIVNCPDCVPTCALCPTIRVDCSEEVKPGTPAICAVMVSGSVDLLSLKWSVHDSNGGDLSERISGQGASISIRTDGLSGQNVTATVEVKGIDPACGRTASGSTAVKP